MDIRPISIYIHYPFCESKCPYCDFNSHVSADVDEDLFLKAYLREISFYLDRIEDKRILRSVFFGGGTPSLMSPLVVEKILHYIFTHHKLVVEEPEVSLEANPSSAEYSKFIDFRKAGVNRLSIGVQALNEEDLKFLGRKHSLTESFQAIEFARKCFENYSIDLIYARPKQTLLQWEGELREALKNLVGTHISLYTLTIEKGTPFYTKHKKGDFAIPNTEDNGKFYDLTNRIVGEYGFDQYEISNYAKKGFECLHNMSYWKCIDYIGVGAGAHGRMHFYHDHRYGRYATQNYALPKKWLEKVLGDGNGSQYIDEIMYSDQVNEIMLMCLRLRSGIDLSEIKFLTGIDLMGSINAKKLEYAIEQGMIQYDKGAKILVASEKGFLVLDSLTKFLLT